MNTDTTSNPATTYIKATDNNINIVQFVQENPIAFKQEFEGKFGILENVQLLHRSQCIRITSTHKQQIDILNTDSIMDLDITPSLPRTKTNQSFTRTISYTTQTNNPQFKCVIRNVAHTITEDDICLLTKANNARRLSRFDTTQNTRIPTQTVILTFSDIPPEIIHIGYSVHRTIPYIPKPIRCNKCQQFGHITSNCRSNNIKCSYCSRQHTYENCQFKQDKLANPPVCANYAGPHSAAYNQCPKFLQLKEALSIKATEHITFKEALNRVNNHQNSTAITTDTTYSTALQTPTHLQQQFTQILQLNEQNTEEIGKLKQLNQTQQIQITDLQNQVAKIKETNDLLIPNITKLLQDHQKQVHELVSQKITFSENQQTVRICQMELSIQRLYETVHTKSHSTQ